MAVIVAALGLMTLPVTLAGYRERGILRRFHASSISASTLVDAQLTLALVTFAAGTLVMAMVARLAYHAMLPQDVLGVVVALLAGTAAFGAIGLLLATAIRTSRSAQGIGLLLFFALWLISGAAPPRAVLPAGLRAVGGVLPLSQLVTAVRNRWFGRDWSATDLAVPGRLRGHSRRPGTVALPLGLSNSETPADAAAADVDGEHERGRRGHRAGTFSRRRRRSRARRARGAGARAPRAPGGSGGRRRA